MNSAELPRNVVRREVASCNHSAVYVTMHKAPERPRPATQSYPGAMTVFLTPVAVHLLMCSSTPRPIQYPHQHRWQSIREFIVVPNKMCTPHVNIQPPRERLGCSQVIAFSRPHLIAGGGAWEGGPRRVGSGRKFGDRNAPGSGR